MFEPEISKSRGRRRLRMLFGGVLCLALLGGIAFAGIKHLETTDELDATRTRLASTRKELARVRESGRTAAEVNATLTQKLAEVQAALDARTAELLTSQTQSNVQAGSIQTLRTCLDGVTRALVQATNNDVGGAQHTLAGVGEACRQAEALL